MSQRSPVARPSSLWALVVTAACSATPAPSSTDADTGARAQPDASASDRAMAAEIPVSSPPIDSSASADAALHVDEAATSTDSAIAPGERADRAADLPPRDASFADRVRDAVEAASPGDAPRPACGAAFCEDFETGQLDPLVWRTQANGGQAVGVVQRDVAAHGQYAVRFHALPNVVSYDFIIAKNAPATLRGHHHGRAYFQVTPRPPAQHMELLFAGTTGFPNLKFLEVATIGTAWQLTFVKLTAPTGETYKPGTGTVPLASWTCLQWEMNDAPDQISLSVDGGAPITFDPIAFDGATTGLVGDFAEFGFGMYIWHPVTYPFDIYYDDIALDPNPVACLPP